MAGGSLEPIRPVLSQRGGAVGWAPLDANEVLSRRCCVCTAGLKPPELRCSNNFNPRSSPPLPALCSPLLRPRQRINRGQLLQPNGGSAPSLVNSQTNGGVYSSAVEPKLGTAALQTHDLGKLINLLCIFTAFFFFFPSLSDPRGDGRQTAVAYMFRHPWKHNEIRVWVHHTPSNNLQSEKQ